jgi:protein TonB
MSPAALALAIGLLVLVAAALWWAAPSRRLDHAETPIMISIDPQPLSAGNAAASAAAASEVLPPEPAQLQATPAEPAPVDAQPTPEPPQQAAAAPAAPTPAEPPPAPPPRQSAEPAPVPTPAPPEEEGAAPAPLETATAAPQPANEAEAETESTWQTDASSWKPQVTLEPSPATPPPRPVRPAPRPPTAPRTAQAPGTRLQDYPPQTSSLGGPSTGSFDQAMGDGGARNDYLSRVYRHIDPYRDYPAAARATGQHGRVVTRVTINRAGQLLDIRLDRSSGWPLIDNAEMAAIRRAMPLPPVPDGMRGDPVVLVLPMNY